MLSMLLSSIKQAAVSSRMASVSCLAICGFPPLSKSTSRYTRFFISWLKVTWPAWWFNRSLCTRGHRSDRGVFASQHGGWGFRRRVLSTWLFYLYCGFNSANALLSAPFLGPSSSLLFWFRVPVITDNEQLHEWFPSLLGLGGEIELCCFAKGRRFSRSSRGAKIGTWLFAESIGRSSSKLFEPDLRSRSECCSSHESSLWLRLGDSWLEIMWTLCITTTAFST